MEVKMEMQLDQIPEFPPENQMDVLVQQVLELQMDAQAREANKPQADVVTTDTQQRLSDRNHEVVHLHALMAKKDAQMVWLQEELERLQVRAAAAAISEKAESAETQDMRRRLAEAETLVGQVRIVSEQAEQAEDAEKQDLLRRLADAESRIAQASLETEDAESVEKQDMLQRLTEAENKVVQVSLEAVAKEQAVSQLLAQRMEDLSQTQDVMQRLRIAENRVVELEQEAEVAVAKERAFTQLMELEQKQHQDLFHRMAEAENKTVELTLTLVEKQQEIAQLLCASAVQKDEDLTSFLLATKAVDASPRAAHHGILHASNSDCESRTGQCSGVLQNFAAGGSTPDILSNHGSSTTCAASSIDLQVHATTPLVPLLSSNVGSATPGSVTSFKDVLLASPATECGSASTPRLALLRDENLLIAQKAKGMVLSHSYAPSSTQVPTAAQRQASPVTMLPSRFLSQQQQQQQNHQHVPTVARTMTGSVSIFALQQQQQQQRGGAAPQTGRQASPMATRFCASSARQASPICFNPANLRTVSPMCFAASARQASPVAKFAPKAQAQNAQQQQQQQQQSAASPMRMQMASPVRTTFQSTDWGAAAPFQAMTSSLPKRALPTVQI